MSLDEFYRLISESLNIPVSYDHFKEAPTLPFIAYIDQGKDTFIADDRVYTKSTNLVIELYTEKKDFSLEEKLESFFESNFGRWEDDETVYIETENLYKHNYYIKI